MKHTTFKNVVDAFERREKECVLCGGNVGLSGLCICESCTKDADCCKGNLERLSQEDMETYKNTLKKSVKYIFEENKELMEKL